MTADTKKTVVGPCIGIDLGTTYSCVAIMKNNNVEIIANDQGNRTTPSCVGFTETERLIGDSAKNQMAMNPKNLMGSVMEMAQRLRIQRSGACAKKRCKVPKWMRSNSFNSRIPSKDLSLMPRQRVMTVA